MEIPIIMIVYIDYKCMTTMHGRNHDSKVAGTTRTRDYYGRGVLSL